MKTKDIIPDVDPHPYSGASWRFFAKIAQKGDFKGRQAQNMVGEGMKQLDKMKISLEDAKRIYGR